MARKKIIYIPDKVGHHSYFGFVYGGEMYLVKSEEDSHENIARRTIKLNDLKLSKPRTDRRKSFKPTKKSFR